MAKILKKKCKEIDYASICDEGAAEPKRTISAAKCTTFEALLSELGLEFWTPTLEEHNLSDLDTFRGHEDGEERLSAELEDACVDPEHATRIVAALFPSASELFTIERVRCNTPPDAPLQPRMQDSTPVINTLSPQS
jgi:hypothetical protein